MIRACFLLVFLFFFIACKKEIEKPAYERTLVVGHGGSGFQQYTNPLPPNSLSSISRAIDGLNTDGVEVDVQITSDGILVLFHDEYLENTTECNGCIGKKRYDEIKDCRYTRDFGNKIFEKETVVTLDSVLQKYSTYSPKPFFYLDIKTPASCPVNDLALLARKIVESVHNVNGKSWIVVESGSIELLQLIKSEDENIKLMIDRGDIEFLIDVAQAKGFQGIVANNDDVTKEQAQKIRSKNLQLVLFNVKEQTSTASALSKNPHSIQTDNIELLQEYLK